MTISPRILDKLIHSVNETIEQASDEVAELDRAIGDGDHVINLQRGLAILVEQSDDISQLEWVAAWQKIGMICMSKIGGASGSLFGTLFVSMAKSAKDKPFDSSVFAAAFLAGVESMKARGKTEAGEKTMLDVLIPVAEYLQNNAQSDLATVLAEVQLIATQSMESTRDMLATKGRASFLEERSIGHIDAGAKSCQLMICAIATTLQSLDKV